MEQRVKEIIIELIENKGQKMEIASLSSSTVFRDLGMTSIDLATLTVMIEDEFDVDIFEEGIVSTIGEVLVRLERA